jgi:SAM-dependent methyltransferase
MSTRQTGESDEIQYHINSKWKNKPKFIMRNSMLFEPLYSLVLKYTVDPLTDKILDVGCGPCNFADDEFIGTIECTDLLSDEYRKAQREINVEDKYLAIGKNIQGEDLTKFYADNTFDISYSRNALDHSEDPVKIIDQMVAVTKKGKNIIIVVSENEGKRNSYTGLHMCDFWVDGDLHVKVKGSDSVNIFEYLGNKVEMRELFMFGHPTAEGVKEIVCVLEKK